MTGDCGMNMLNYDANNKKILVASRHLRNDSKTIQLELRYDNNASAQLPDGYAKKSKRHYRSSSCDVKIIRSNSRDYDAESRLKKHIVVASSNNSHTRNNSRDLNEPDFRTKLTHTRNNSKDTNIKFILNYLNATNPRASSRKHSRNHSYDQIYMPSNIKIDQELHKKFSKGRKNSSTHDYDVNVLQQPNAAAAAQLSSAKVEYMDGKFGAVAKNHSKDCLDASEVDSIGLVIDSIYHHSRSNSKDLNYLKTVEDTTGANSVLRHRRTSSKDLNRGLAAVTVMDGGRHTRTGSSHLIDHADLPLVTEPAVAVAAQFLLRRDSDVPMVTRVAIESNDYIDERHGVEKL